MAKPRIWIKNIGASDDRLPPKWYDEGSDEGEFRWFVRFSDAFQGKSIVMNDLLLYNAFITGQSTGRLCGIARVSSTEPIEASRTAGDQWPWKRSVTPLLIVPLGTHGPTLSDIGVDTPPMGGYKEIAATQYVAAARLMSHNALPESLGLRP